MRFVTLEIVDWSRPCLRHQVLQPSVFMFLQLISDWVISRLRCNFCILAVIPELCENKNGGCEHFCNVDGGNVRCSCADGYFLASDDKSCMSNSKRGRGVHHDVKLKTVAPLAVVPVTKLPSQTRAEPFKCGAIVSDSVRTIFRYERQNVSETNVTETKAIMNSTEAQQEVLEPSLPENTSQIRTEDLISEKQIVPQRATQTRIVNGEDCPPGQCPWQVASPTPWDVLCCCVLYSLLLDHVLSRCLRLSSWMRTTKASVEGRSWTSTSSWPPPTAWTNHVTSPSDLVRPTSQNTDINPVII